MPCRTRGTRPTPRTYASSLRSVLSAHPAPSVLLPSGPSQEENACPKDLAAGTHAQTAGCPILARLQALTHPGARVGVHCPRGSPVTDPPPGLWLHSVRLPTCGETALGKDHREQVHSSGQRWHKRPQMQIWKREAWCFQKKLARLGDVFPWEAGSVLSPI